MSETNERTSLLSRLGRWLAELILVFVGVYAAFWLNNYQQHREQIQRRDQILAYLAQRLQDGIDSAKTDGAHEERQVAEFQRALAAGKCHRCDRSRFLPIIIRPISLLCSNPVESSC